VEDVSSFAIYLHEHAIQLAGQVNARQFDIGLNRSSHEFTFQVLREDVRAREWILLILQSRLFVPS
jgi:hypothetical protein